jgi:hypothetical protein
VVPGVAKGVLTCGARCGKVSVNLCCQPGVAK